jgi:hypothetical protein
MSRPPSAATLAHRKQMAYENVRAAYLAAKQRVITARLKAGRKQLPLPFELKETA